MKVDRGGSQHTTDGTNGHSSRGNVDAMCGIFFSSRGTDCGFRVVRRLRMRMRTSSTGQAVLRSVRTSPGVDVDRQLTYHAKSVAGTIGREKTADLRRQTA